MHFIRPSANLPSFAANVQRTTNLIMRGPYFLRWVLIKLYLLGALFSVSATAQTPPDEMVRINMNNADIREVIQWVSEQTQKNFIIDPRVKGKLSVLSSQPMTMEEAYQVFLTALDVYGFAVVESGNNVKVIPNAQARSSGLPIVEAFSQGDADSAELVVHVLRIENISAAEVVTVLRPLVPQTGHLAAFPSSNSVIVADRANNIRRLSDLIRQIDATGALQVEVIPLEFATADDIITVIQPLLRQGNQAGSTGVRFASDERSNSILMTGPADARADVRSLIDSLDRPLQGAGNTKVIYLNYIEATEIAGILESMTGTIVEEGQDQRVTVDDISIAVSETTNAIIVSAPPSILESLEAIIADLDIRRSQVLIEALIVEVTDSFALDTEVLWATQNISDNTPAAAISSANLASTTTTGALASNTPNAAFLQGGFNWGFYRNGTLRALFRAIETDNNNNVLSRPSIITLDNEEAEVIVGSNVPFVTGSQVSAATNVNNPFQTIQREDIGITLRITPNINKNQTITLDIEQEVESVREEVLQGASDLVTDIRSISTQVLLNNTEILVLGGLTDERVTRTQSKVPILGDIPLVGRLFRSTSDSVTKQNLMIFIQPTILDEHEDLDRETRERYEAIREVQDNNDQRRTRKEINILLPEWDEANADNRRSEDFDTANTLEELIAE